MTAFLAAPEVPMTDKPTIQADTKNKFNRQNQSAEDRKAADNPRQGEPAVEPTKETQQDKPVTEPGK